MEKVFAAGEDFSDEGFGEIVSSPESFSTSSGTPDDAFAVQPSENVSFAEVANFFVALAIIFAAALSVIYVFVGGINFILSSGDETKIKKAVQTIRYSIIGLVITIFAITIIAILGSIFNFNLISYLSWDKISEMMGVVISRLTETQLPSTISR